MAARNDTHYNYMSTTLACNIDLQRRLLVQQATCKQHGAALHMRALYAWSLRFENDEIIGQYLATIGGTDVERHG